MSVRKGNDVLAGSAPLKIDNVLNEASVNPVQNSVITAALANKADAATTYTKTEIDEAIATKQDTISSGNGITIINNVVAVGDLDCGTMS